MSKPAPTTPFSLILQTTLMSLAEQYQIAVTKEESLKKARKHLEEDLNEMGSDEKVIRSEKFRTTASSLTVTNRAIEQVRAEQEYLNDTIVELLVDAKQGKFWEAAELEGRMNRQNGPAMPLFDRAMAMATEAHPNVGESDEDAAAKRTKPDGAGSSSVVVDADEPPSEIARKTWRMLSVSVIKGLTPDCVKALQDVGLMNLNDVDRFLHEEKRSLATIDGFRRADSSKVYAEVDRWRKLDTDADAKAAAPKPAENGKPKGKGGRKAVGA